MDDDTNWSPETYTLENITKFKLPCEIRMTEGFYDEDDDSEDTFSAGDIITIGEKQTVQKVSAKFTNTVSEASLAKSNYDYVKLTKEEQILLPLNYKGSLRVLRHLKKFETVRDMAEDFPRYARVCEGFKLRTEDNVSFPILEGTVIELLRINRNTSGIGDELVVRHKYRKEVKDSFLPFKMKKQFESVTDIEEYTIQEAIERYALPLLVQFTNADAIRRAYGKGKTITDTVRLEEKVTQGMLFGNCKFVADESTPVHTEPQKGTPIVLPLTNPAVRSIEVHVRPGCSSDYEDVAFLHITDGSIYEDYATFSSKIKRLRTESSEPDGAPKIPPRDKPTNTEPSTNTRKQHGNKLPALPEERILRPPPEKKQSSPTHLQIPSKPNIAHKKHKKDKEHNKKMEEKTQRDVISDTKPALPPRRVAPGSHEGLPLPPLPVDDKANRSRKAEYMNHPKTRRTHEIHDINKPSEINEFIEEVEPVMDPKSKHQKESKYTTLHVEQFKPPGLNDYEDMNYNPGLSPYDTISEYVGSDELNPYEELDNLAPTELTERKKPSMHVRGHKQDVPEARMSVTAPSKDKPSPAANRKQFIELNCDEVAERLRKCGLSDIADMCEEDETINGEFFLNLNEEDLKKYFNISGLRLAKFLQMRDNNWVPP